MESVQSYFDRKQREISLLNACLRQPIPFGPARTVSAIVEQKFRLAAALKAQQTLDHWAFTETAWTEEKEFRSGPFRFCYDYQRAGLRVSGPPVYEALASIPQNYFQRTIYTSSGMAAISALLGALEQLNKPLEVIAFPGTYGETLELMEGYSRNLRLQRLTNWRQSKAQSIGYKVVWIDCCIGSMAFQDVLNSPTHPSDLIVFDTTGLWVGSGRIQRVLNWAIGTGAPIVLLRSHTKLDSLGVEYGRLGSLVFVGTPEWKLAEGGSLECISEQVENAVRLFGGTAVPAHFPPFIGNSNYACLGRQRIAAMLHNSRRIRKRLRIVMPSAELDFVHGLYVALMPDNALTQQQAKKLAETMCRDLAVLGLPVHHAGSFGFDFAAAEWFRDLARDRHLVRVAVPDLPTELWNHLVREIIQWWNRNAGSPRSRAGMLQNTYRRGHTQVWRMSLQGEINAKVGIQSFGPKPQHRMRKM